MTPEVQAALAYVAEFDGDPRCSLNCHYSEILAAEVRRLEGMRCETCAWQHNYGAQWVCGKTRMNDGVHITVTTVPCSFLGNGCRAWEGR